MGIETGGEQDFNLDALDGRIYPEAEMFFKKVIECGSQDECPWGDLTQLKKGELLDVPFALEIGGGRNTVCLVDQLRYMGVSLKGIIEAKPYLPQPWTDGDKIANLKMDITSPGEIDLGGVKVPFVFSGNVFSGDSCGVCWPSEEVREKSTRALCELVIPGGVICFMGNFIDGAVDKEVLFEEFGAKEIPGKIGRGSYMLQIGV
ncbi:hypothetical protein KJ632_02380 [Patescibacteria group bacterium]|nr:hypothetical protein [Patescibacteria group bacterium]